MTSKMTRTGIYPGTFDPITKGHLHIIQRASKLVDRLIVGVAPNTRKGPLFSQEERVKLVSEDIANMHAKHCEIEVEAFDELLIHYVQRKKAQCIFRGLRATSDFEYEFQMTGMNAQMEPDIETVFLMASDKYQFVSSSFIKEIHALDGDISKFVTPAVLSALEQKKNQRKS